MMIVSATTNFRCISPPETVCSQQVSSLLLPIHSQATIDGCCLLKPSLRRALHYRRAQLAPTIQYVFTRPVAAVSVTARAVWLPAPLVNTVPLVRTFTALTKVPSARNRPLVPALKYTAELFPNPSGVSLEKLVGSANEYPTGNVTSDITVVPPPES